MAVTIQSANFEYNCDYNYGGAYARGSDMAPVFICLLGHFQMFKQGQPLFNNSHKAELLLSTLALNLKRSVSRPFLLDLLWPDTEVEAAGTLLRGLLYKLRQSFNGILGGQPLVVRDNEAFRLNLDAGIGIDVAEFEASVARGDQAVRANDQAKAVKSYAAASELYRGDLLAHGFAEVEVERERLRGLYLRALRHLTHNRFDGGDYIGAIDYAQRILRNNPFCEGAHRMIMHSHTRQNERGQALRQFQLCQAVLKAEFGVEPERETLALFEQIRLNPGKV